MNNKEQKFYSILQDLFVGAKLEGESGYVNLMNIKTEYFKRIEKNLKSEVKKKFGNEEPEDLYDKLYSFFDSYISDGGAIFFSSTPVYKNIYSKVYSDREDTALFWKTAKLYYVKSEANYKSIDNLQLHGEPEIAFDFHFDASLLKHKQANEKKELDFYFTGVKPRKGKKVIKFHVLYKNDNKYTALEEKLKAKGKDAVIKNLFNEIEKMPSGIILKNEGIDLAKINFKGDKGNAKAEFVVSENKNTKSKIEIIPAVVGEKEIEKYLRLKGINLSEEEIQKAYRVYKKQTEIDYFIHKDAKGFLREQFDLFIYQYLANDLDSLFKQEDLDRIKKLKEIAYQTIEYIGNFEDELKKMWLKPKFARKSNYVLTIDRLADKTGGMKVIEKIIGHKNFKEQIAEWIDLGIAQKDFNKKEILAKDKLSDKWSKLPIDTKFFKDLEIEIIGLFDNLDEALDGRLIKSDNFQALNTLLPKYKGEVQTIYIDPPFNTNSSPIAYVNDYKDSSWLTLMENRLDISRHFLKNNGINITAIDDVELRYITTLQDNVFGKDNYITTIASECNPQGRVANKVSQTSEYHVIHANNKEAIDKLYVKKLEIKKPSSLKRTGTNSRREERPNRYYPILLKKDKIYMIEVGEYEKIYNKTSLIFDDNFINSLNDKYTKLGYNFILPLGVNGKKLVWQRTFRRVQIEKDTYIVKDKSIFTPTFEIEIPKTLWKHPLFSNPEYGSEYLTNMLGHSEFETPKSFYTIMQFLTMVEGGGYYLDYFGGSGTTAQAVIELNKLEDEIERKYLIFEMGEYFYSVIIPRLKKLCISNKWKTGLPINMDGSSQFFKYYELEQYEDVLKNACYQPTDKRLENINLKLSGFKNKEEKDNKTKEVNQAFAISEKQAKDGMEIDFKKEKARFTFEKLYPDVDIVETISNLEGKKIKKILKDKVVFADDTEIDLNNLDFEKHKNLQKLIYW